MSSRASHSFDIERLVVSIRRVMEGLWLSAVLFVPLIMVSFGTMLSPFETPKVVLLRTVIGLLGMLWVVETALVSPKFRRPRTDAWWSEFLGWLRAEPVRLVFLAAVLFLAANVLSTLWSISLHTSLWGKDPGDDGYGLYTITSYFVLFAVIGTHANTRAKIWRLMGVVVATGTLVSLYGCLQYLGIDPYTWTSDSGTRIISTIGNPVHVGAFLVLTIPISIACAIVIAQNNIKRRWLPLWAFILGSQFLALLFTMGRGAWVGLFIGLLAFLTLTLLAFPNREFAIRTMRVAIMLVIITVLALLIGSGKFGVGGWGPVTSAVERGSTIFSGGSQGTGADRLDVWKDSLHLAFDRPTPAYLDDPMAVTRHIVGYGPETFPYVLPARITARPGAKTPHYFDYAHNHYIHELVEIGILGLLSYLLLILCVAIVGIRKLAFGWRSSTREERWILIGLLSLLTAHVIEGIPGLPKVTDQTIFWGMLGLFVALPRAMRSTDTEPVRALRSEHSSSYVKRTASLSGHRPQQFPAIALVLAGVFVILIAVLTWQKSIDYWPGSIIAANALEATDQGDSDEGLRLMKEAIAKTPDVKDYHLFLVGLFSRSRELNDDPKIKLHFADKAYDAIQVALQVAPHSVGVAQHAGDATLELGLLGIGGKIDEAWRYYDLMKMMDPSEYQIYDVRANAYLKMAEPAKALEETEVSLALHSEPGVAEGRHSYLAYLLKGLAHSSMGDFEEALVAIDRSIELNQQHDTLSEPDLEEAKRIRSGVLLSLTARQESATDNAK